jgi:hypothetical protein
MSETALAYPAQLWPAQQTFLTPPHLEHGVDITLFTGERSSGKTYAATLLALKLALETEGSVGLVLVPNKLFFWDVLEPLFLKHLSGLKVEKVKFSSTRMRYKLANGSEIRIRTVRQDLQPSSLHWVYVADLHSISQQQYLELITQLRADNAPMHRLFAEANGHFLRGTWQHMQFEDPAQKRPRTVRVLRGVQKDNKALPKWQLDPSLRPQRISDLPPAITEAIDAYWGPPPTAPPKPPEKKPLLPAYLSSRKSKKSKR